MLQNLNVAALMDTWTKQMNHPSLTIERKENSSNQYTIQQRRFLINPTTEVFATTDSPYKCVSYNISFHSVVNLFIAETNTAILDVKTNEKLFDDISG
ncbi:hypothetical protein AVEN_1643-1 [Araneus ventricosus]|uniref:Uncharacterized protein n=1 Tax=Araneus ventricosus TaxID=182803 RepID=A0A4Y2R6L3_ARAVE|nr:hypothetical protein AVEN_1643-1 [Araneus ventricosus]